MKHPLRITALVSGRGSNLMSLLEDAETSPDLLRYVRVISNVIDAPALAIAENRGIPTSVIDHRSDHRGKKTRQQFDEEIDAILSADDVQLVVLAGFMRLLTPWFADRWRDRLVNIHPSLLPSFPGLHAHKQALDYGVKVSGCTVHFVRPAMDHGPIISQSSVPVLDDDSEESLAARVLQTEHKLYPACIRLIAEGRVNVIDEKVFLS